MKSREQRKTVTFLHLIIGGFLAAYVYSPIGELASIQLLVKALLLPLLIFSGLWLWKGHLVKQLFKSKTTLLSLLTVFSFHFATAQETTTKEVASKRWGIEYSPVGYGLFRISQGKVTYALNVEKKFKTELGLGLLVQPYSAAKGSESFNQDGAYSAFMASVAVRQYFWKGLHLEQVINLGRGSIRNSLVTGNDYDAFVVFSQSFLGYRFDFLKNRKVGFYVIGQMGMGYVPVNTNQWPRVEENGSSIYPLGDLKVGISF
ncbi:hypothetical protein [Pararhodonellum marinum]|uniref:hypothetical protein n=1 Tax=Pararhodonellum marinum TaxID=2755358 RepID=UPI00188EFF87|nr:hypothetical protein [Pararhodonellum marinum]